MPSKHFRDLIVWQKSMDLVVLVYDLVKYLPLDERFGLSDQMRRAAVSIPSNIAEGQARGSSKYFVQFLQIANGSKAELQTQLLLCERLQLITNAKIRPIFLLLDEIGRMIASLIRNLEQGK